MLDDRKAAILKAVVEEYIETAQPVGSSRVASASNVKVSPATVRNEMATLERDGFLVQPHTSAGRIPTDKGYRFFVDQLTPSGRLSSPQRQEVVSFFDHTHGALEQMLSSTSKLLANLTNYAAVVVGPPHEAATIKAVQLVSLSPHSVLFVSVLSNGVVEKRLVELADEVSEAKVVGAGARLASHLVGRTVNDLGAVPQSGDAETDALSGAAVTELAGHDASAPDHVFVGGTSMMASAFDAVDTVRGVLEILEQQFVVVSLLRDVLNRGLSVAIGTEVGHQSLAECSVVVAPYEIEGEVAGTVGVVGPTRMKYPEALAAVALVGKRLGNHLSEG